MESTTNARDNLIQFHPTDSTAVASDHVSSKSAKGSQIGAAGKNNKIYKGLLLERLSSSSSHSMAVNCISAGSCQVPPSTNEPNESAHSIIASSMCGNTRVSSITARGALESLDTCLLTGLLNNEVSNNIDANDGKHLSNFSVQESFNNKSNFAKIHFKKSKITYEYDVQIIDVNCAKFEGQVPKITKDDTAEDSHVNTHICDYAEDSHVNTPICDYHAENEGNPSHKSSGLWNTSHTKSGLTAAQPSVNPTERCKTDEKYLTFVLPTAD